MRPRIPIVCLALTLLIGAGAPLAAQPAGPARQLRDRVAATLEQTAGSFDGVAGFAILDLTTGERFDRLATQVFPTASTIKIAILYELLRQADEKRVVLDDPRPLAAAHRVGGSGILNELTAPVLSLRDFAILMMMLSDNSATNVVIDTVGKDAVNARMRMLGLETIALRRRMMDTEAAKRGEENLASPADLVRLLQIVDRGEGLSPASRQAALDIMAKPMSTALRRGVPAGVRVASKPGGLDGVAVDAGLVYIDKRPFAIAVMTTFGADAAEADRTITAITKTAVSYFSRLARAGTAGRLF